MVYDEGFSFDVYNLSFFAFSNYAYDNAKKSQSRCYSTCVGWYLLRDSKKWGCYQAMKLEVGDSEQVTYSTGEKGLNIVQPESSENITSFLTNLMSFREVDTIESRKYGEQDTMTSFLAEHEASMSRLDSTFTKHHLYIDKLNSIPKSWTAALHDNFENLSIKQLNRMAGIPRTNSFRFKARNVETSEDLSEYPTNFNWKEKLKPAGSQGNCGSCYVYSTMRMLQARLNIHYDHDVTLSVQHSLDCSFYNQGCNGGYPFLVMKYGSEFEYIPEACKPYQESTGECFKNTCNIAELPYIYKAKDYKYVGGSYGKCSEKSMLDELFSNGPIVVSFEPDYNFMMYKTGIYHTISDDTWVSHAVPKPEWEKVDHSVLLVGWGEENGDKFWLLQNTWGPNWGEDGFFRMRRGKDEFGIESICESATPRIIDNKTGQDVTKEQLLKNTSSIFDIIK
jgi:cathepsin C